MRRWAVDLYSDTKTRPSPAMLAEMTSAETGDEQQDEDPTVAALTERVADLLGKEAALFLPSGTMANLISVLVHCRRGDEILAEASSHVLHFETGGPAGIAGATITAIPGTGGVFETAAVQAALRTPRRNAPRPRLIWVEQTTNLGGGRVWPIERLRELRAFADENGLAVHFDGARLMNASVAAALAPADYGACADSLWIDFTKGLGAPFGAVLASDSGFVEDARRFKHMLGGAMRQGGVMAAACLFALDHHVERLAEDHGRARQLRQAITEMPGLAAEDPETNIVMVDTAGSGRSAADFAAALAAHDIRVGVFGSNRLRAITHLDIDDAGLARAIDAFAAVAG
jgi:threonine aldolase